MRNVAKRLDSTVARRKGGLEGRPFPKPDFYRLWLLKAIRNVCGASIAASPFHNGPPGKRGGMDRQ